MRRPAVRAATVGVALLATALAGACSSDAGTSAPGDTITASPTSSAPPSSATPSPSKPVGDNTPSVDDGPPKVLGTIATGLAAPWGIGFLPNGDAVVTERDTRRVLVLSPPAYDVREAGTISAAVPLGDQGGEAGLLGVAVSPDFAQDHLLYFYLSTASDNRIVRARLDDGRLGPTSVVLDGIPNGFIHDGGRLVFGPDGYLYASTGETGQPDLAQDRSTLAGKVLRMTTDGRPAPGNPFPGSQIWSYGHRNVQGLAFDDDGRLWASEFGQDTYDELNLIEKGRNYGWPMVEGRGDGAGLTNPQVVWDTDDASPSGLAYLDGHLWMAALRGERLWRVDVHGDHAVHPVDYFVGRYGRMRTVVVAPDGNLWVSTSNRDGRGEPRPGDDRILLVRP
ncbi:PQQ-dependent sugar dehydrogenase [Nocardioides sp.]|uniref:PQQ-dependent sugar dehydrogenase n=1 Tax=Nocardioides sp. TaxID=35761 RepID=UPI00378340D0